MNCQAALDRILEADPALLRGGPSADDALAEHLRGCSRCRAVADALTRELATLDAGLGDLASSRAGDEEVRRRPAPALPPQAWRWIPLAAAAALAAVLLLGRYGGPPDRAPAAADLAAEPGRGPEATVAVALPDDRGAAVMSTANPKITVVWLYERSER